MDASLPKKFIGHIEIRKNLAKLTTSKKLPGAILFCGPSGVGKKTLARLLARNIINGSLTNTADPFNENELKTNLAYPDIFEVDASEKEDVSSEEIREMLTSIYRTSSSGNGRIVIINNAEMIPVISSNILLKTLEEPRAGQFFILVSSNPSKILPTILSRCSRINFSSLSEGDIEEIIKSSGWELPLSSKEASFLADGSLEEIKNSSTKHDDWIKFSALFDKICQGDLALGLSSISSVTKEKDKDELKVFLTMLRLYLRQRMVTTLDPRWAVAIQNLTSAWRYIFERNLSANLILSNLITLIAKGARDTNVSKAVLLEEMLEG